MSTTDLRVALLTDAFITEEGRIVDGVANTLHRLARFCGDDPAAHGVRLEFFTHSTGSESVEELGRVRIHRYRPLAPMEIHPGWWMDHSPFRPSIVRELERFNPDLLHIATPGSMGHVGLAAARRLRSRVLMSYHTAYQENVSRRVAKMLRIRSLPHRSARRLFAALTWRYVTWFFNHANRIVAPSRHARDELARRVRPPVGIFSRGVDTDRFNPRLRTPPLKTTAIHVGRLVVDKNLETLVEVFRDRRDVDLVVAGDGPERGWLETALPNARFTGHLPPSELAVEYASADLFVFPSETETFGNVALEAMASGLPVVTSDVMAPQELIDDGVNGFVGTVGVDFHRKVDRLIRDRKLRRFMGVNARDYALARRWETVFEGLLHDYREVAGSSHHLRLARATQQEWVGLKASSL